MSNSLGQAHPVDISYGAKTLSAKQQRVLEQLPNDGSRHTFHKNDVSMMDLSALTAHTGNEFAMFTHEGNRVVYRGNGERVYFPPKELNELMASGARFSGHTHTGTDLTPSKEDLDFLRMIGQKTSSIYNIYGRHEVIRVGG